MTKSFSHPLMDDNITKNDLAKVIKFLKQKKIILTQSKNVKIFETMWSKWLGVKYSVFVNSGTSANILSMSILKILSKKKEVVVPSLTWVSDINSVILNNFNPKFVDINLNNLSMNLEDVKKVINKNTAGVFLTHAQGFNGLNLDILKFLRKKNIPLIEDVCESHGATFRGKKLGTFGLISNFSFYYAHHLSTIEGGMICTNNRKIYELARMLRSHGMLRECGNKNFEQQIIKKNPKLYPKFIFLYKGFNFRNNEIGAIIGINQLKRLNKNNKIRAKNFKLFIENIDKKKYFTQFDFQGNSNYAFPIILNTRNIKSRNLFEQRLNENRIEFRRGNAGGGNQIRQPYIKEYVKKIDLKKFKNVEIVNSFGYYIGNYPSLKKDKILKICKILNNINF